MDKLDKTRLMRVFDNICKNKQYVQYYKGARIVSYNDPIKEELLIQIHHTFNNDTRVYCCIFRNNYLNFNINHLANYYRVTYRNTIYGELKKLKEFIN